MGNSAELLVVLEERLAAVADRDLYHRDPAAHLVRLQEATSRLEAIIQSLPPETDPMLRHYLERQSYLKAIDWLKSNQPG